MLNTYLKILKLTFEEYQNSNKDINTVYFLTDTLQIYIGDKIYMTSPRIFTNNEETAKINLQSNSEYYIISNNLQLSFQSNQLSNCRIIWDQEQGQITNKTKSYILWQTNTSVNSAENQKYILIDQNEIIENPGRIIINCFYDGKGVICDALSYTVPTEEDLNIIE